jgi:hypothetical protein
VSAISLLGEAGRLLSRRDRGDNIRGKEAQPQARVEIGGLDLQLREGGNHARIFVAPIDSGPRQQLRPPASDTRADTRKPSSLI